MAISLISFANTVVTASRSPSVTLTGYTPKTDDVVVIWVASTVVSAITTPATWVNPLGGNTLVASDSHSQCCVYHLVTSAEETAVTITYTATNLWNANATGNVLGVVLRGVDAGAVVDSAASTFNSANTVTPHVLAALVGSDLSTGSCVLSAVAKDATGTYTRPSGWTFITSNNTNQGHNLYNRTNLTTAGVNVDATNITPSAGDEYCSITVAFTAAATSPSDSPQFQALSIKASNNPSTSACNVPIPPGVVANDIVLVAIRCDQIGTAELTWTTVDTGFTEATASPGHTAQGGANGTDFHVFWKRIIGGHAEEDAGTYDFVLSAAASPRLLGIAARYSGCITSGDPIDAANSAGSVGTTTAFPDTSLTTTVDDTLLLWLACSWNVPNGVPSGFVEQIEETANGAHIFSDKVQAVAGATGIISATGTSGNQKIVWLGALKPSLPSALPVFGSVSSELTGSSSTTANVPVPAAVAADDIILALFYIETTQAVTPPSGFTEAPDSPAVVTGAGNHNLRVFWKRATGADSGTYNFTIASGLAWRQAVAARFTGCVTTGNPFDVTNSAIKTTTTTAVTPAVSDTTTDTNRLWVWVGSLFGGAGSTACTPPSGVIERFEYPAGSNGLTFGDMDQVAAGSSGSLVGTFASNGATAAWLGALLPSQAQPSMAFAIHRQLTTAVKRANFW